MGSDGIEIAQHDGLNRRAAGHSVAYDFLVDLLGVAIRAFSLLDRSLLCGGQVVGLAINRAAAGEYNAFDIVLRHQLQEVDKAYYVVAIVKQWLLHAFAHSLAGSEVDDTLNLRIFLEHCFSSIKIAKVHLLESRTNACNLLDTIENIFTRIGQVVYNNDIIACILKFYSSVRTDESGTTCYEDCLFHFIIEYVLLDALKLMFITTSRCKCSRFFDMVKGFIKKNEH